ncbi:MAG TPA: hypothetical protein VMG98_05510 [Verrucomicrobiae bacterium]|nr:hypothetical protein [Verrucomicrobiae bacterium]
MTAALLALSACGGGGGGSPIPSGNGSQPSSQGTGPAQLIVSIPPLTQQNTHFRPNYISAGTQSMTVGLVSGGTTTSLATVNLTTASSSCTTPSGGGLQCTVTVQAPFGTDTFAISTYSGLNAGGSVLSTGDIQVTLTRGEAAAPVQLDLNGVPATVALVLGQSELPVGNAGSTSVIVQARDASGNLIIGPGLFSTPIDLAITGDTYGTLSLSSTSVNTPGQVVTLNYNGGTNVGSTITPSASGLTSATAVKFNATGGVLNLYQYYDTTNGVSLETYDLAPLANGKAAVVSEVYDDAADSSFEGIAIASPTTIDSIFVGGTSDYYSPATSPQTIPGVTYIPNMSIEINHEEFDSYDDVAGANGFVYYSGSTDSPEDAPTCSDDTLQTGTIGKMNAVTGATTEYVLKGYAGAIKVDSSGNAWFIEGSGYCGESQLISGSVWAIGELTVSGTLKETSFSTAGLSGIGYPADMAINGAGTEMFIADGDNSTVTAIATSTLSSPSTVALNLSAYPQTVAVGSDGTAAWFGDDEIEDHYYYGYVPGTKTFSTSNLAEDAFPIEYYYAYTMAYADGSFWLAGPNDEASGIGRLSGFSSSSPVAGYYPPPSSGEDEEVEMYSIAAGGGYVWVDDPCQGVIYALIYGAPSSGNITYATHRLGTIAYRTAAQMHRMAGHHAVDTHRHRPEQIDPVERRLLAIRP